MLRAAAEKYNSFIIAWLLEKGIDVNQIDSEGNTALDILIRNGVKPSSRCVKILTAAGACLNTQEYPSNEVPSTSVLLAWKN